MTHITEAIRNMNEGIGSKIANSDVMRKLEGKLSKADSAIRIGRLGIELAVHRIDMIKQMNNLEIKDINDLLLKTKKELVKDLVAIRKFEKLMK